MRLLLLGPLEGYISIAGKIALARGAKVTHVDDIERALAALRSGNGAELVMMDVKLDVRQMVDSLKQERISVPVVACGIGTDAEAAVRAIKAGAREYIPLPPDAALIAAVLEAVAEESSAVVWRDPAMEKVLRLAEQVAPADASILLTGESGTRQEVVARFVPRQSRRARHNVHHASCAPSPA